MSDPVSQKSAPARPRPGFTHRLPTRRYRLSSRSIADTHSSQFPDAFRAGLYVLSILLLGLHGASQPLWISGITAAVLALSFTLLLAAPAVRLGLVDIPGGRKAHAQPTPLTGGLAILGSTILLASLSRCPNGLLPFLAFAALVGTLDDAQGLSARARLGLMAAMFCVMAWATGLRVTDLGNLLGFGTANLGYASLGFTVLCGTGLINAINMADGVDGLAGGLVATSLGALGFACWMSRDLVPPELTLFIAALLGFLAVNARHPVNPRAKAFLGDGGSMLLGTGLAWYAMQFSQGTERAVTPAALLWIIGLPVLDTLRVMVQRPLRRGVNSFTDGRDHLHHRLLDSGMTPTRTMLTLVSLNVLFCAVGVLGQAFLVPEPVLAYPFLFIAVGFIFVFPQQ